MSHYQIGNPIIGHTDWVTSVSYIPGSTKIISGSYDNTLRIWDVLTGEPIGQPFIKKYHYINSISCNVNGKHVVSGSIDNTVIIWDINTGKPLREPLQKHSDRVTCVSYSPDGKQIISGSWDESLIIWDANTGKPIGRPLKTKPLKWCSNYDHRITCMSYSPDGKRIISGTMDGTLSIWDISTKKKL